MTIAETLESSPVSDLDLSRFVSVQARSTVAETVSAMAAAGETCACIVDGDALVGIFTERDVLMRVLGRPVTFDRSIAEEMAVPVKTMRIDAPVAAGLAIMNHWWVRNVPVLDGRGLAGNLSYYTIMRTIAELVAQRGAPFQVGVKHGFELIDFTGLNTAQAVTMPADETLDVVIHHMRARAVGSMLVVDDREHLVGVLTEYDLLTRIGCDRTDFSDVMLGDVMTPEPVALSVRSSITEAIREMARRGFSHIPLLGESGRPVGVASFRDLAAYFEMSVAALA